MDSLKTTQAEKITTESSLTSNSMTEDTTTSNPANSSQGDLKTCGYCCAPCEKKCSNCSKVDYCGTEHQKLHHKVHKEHCFPAVEVKNDKYGRHLVATKMIVAGAKILTDNPLVVSPMGNNTTPHPICLGCCKVLPGNFGRGTQLCKNCFWPLCSQNCEKIQLHSQNECEIFKSQKIRPSVFMYDLILPLRILLLKEKDPIKFSKLLELESHVEIRKQSNADSRLVDGFINFIYGTCKLNQTVYSKELIDKVFGVTLFNSVQTTVKMIPGNVAESSIYQWTSKLTHNCIPNVEVASLDLRSAKSVRMIATVEMQKGDILSECYLRGTIHWQGIAERRKNLHENYNFWCTCLKCSDPTELGTNFSAIKCKNKDNSGKLCNGFYLPQNSLNNESVWICNSGSSGNCSARKYSEFSNVLRSIEHDILVAKSIQEKITVIDKHANTSVHENHFTLMKLRFDLLSDIFVKIELFGIRNNYWLIDKMKEIALKCLEVVDKFTPGLNKHRGHVLFILAHALYFWVWTQTEDRVGSEEDPNVLLEELRKISLIRDEVKVIFKNSRKDSKEYSMYEYLIQNDDKFTESHMIFTVQALTVRVYNL